MRAIGSVIAILVVTGAAFAQDMPLKDILIEGESWKPFFKDCKSIAGLAVAPDGDLYLSDSESKTTVAVSSEGKLAGVRQDSVAARMLAIFLSTGGAKACHAKSKDFRWYDTLRADGAIQQRRGDSEPQKIADGLKEPVGLVLWPDEGTLVVSELHGRYLWTYRVEKDGSLTCKDKYYTLRKPSGNTELTVGTMTVDDAGRLYCATSIGVQVFDPTGRMSGVLTAPKDAACTHVALGGEKGSTLFVACGNEVFARQIKGKGVPWKEKSK